MTDKPATPSPPDWGQALNEFGKSLGHVAGILHAYGAFGWVYRGNLEEARKGLEGMTPEVLQQVSVTAAALSSLADEVAAGETIASDSSA